MNQDRKKTSCDRNGHLWTWISDPTIQHCGRSACSAMRRQQPDGSWQEYHSRQKPLPTAPQPVQRSMWT